MNEYKKIVQETLTERDLLEQLAEEAADAVFEELNDVLIVAEALGIFLGDHKMDNHKWQRWAERVAGK